MPRAGSDAGSHLVAPVHVALAPVEHRVALLPLALCSETHEGRHDRALDVCVSACRARRVSRGDCGCSAVCGCSAEQRIECARLSTPCLPSPPSIPPSTGRSGPRDSPAPLRIALRPTAEHSLYPCLSAAAALATLRLSSTEGSSGKLSKPVTRRSDTSPYSGSSRGRGNGKVAEN
jgi:hypothetical protein